MNLRQHSYDNPLYNTWKDIKKRCTNPNRRDYKWYGGKGISFCERWRSFDNFVEDMGDSYFSGATIDRLDNDKDYCKDNCTWSSKSKQQQNRGNVKGHWRRAEEIKDLRRKGYSQQSIADLLGMSQGTVSHILAGNIPKEP